VSYTVTLVAPGSTFPDSENLAADVARTIGGAAFAAIFLAGLIVGQFTSGLAAIFLDVATSTSFINFGAFLAFTLVNVSAFAHFLRHRGEQRLNPLFYVVIPIIGALVDVYLLTRLDGRALVLGGCWLAAGLIYLVVMTRGFRKAPPELSIAE
jgi:hypothetical protein